MTMQSTFLLVALLTAGLIARLVWVNFAPDLRAGFRAVRQYFKRSVNEPAPTRYPDNVIPFMTPDRQEFLRRQPKHMAMNRPTPKIERRK